MKPFYTLVRIVPGPSGSDVITVGLLAHTGTKLHLRISPFKVRLARHFFNSDIAHWVDNTLKQLHRKIQNANERAEEIESRKYDMQQTIALHSDTFDPLAFSFGEVDYMHRYYNGLLQFSTPTPVATELTDKVLGTLYKSFVSAHTEEPVYTVEDVSVQLFQDRVEKRLLNRVANKVNVNLPVREFVLPSLHFPFEMDCIGINGALVGAFAIDFSQSSTTTDKKFGHYVDVINRLIYKYQRQETENAFYLIVDEPVAAQSEKIKQFRSWREHPQVKVIGSQEVTQVAERIERTNAHPLVPFADTLAASGA